MNDRPRPTEEQIQTILRICDPNNDEVDPNDRLSRVALLTSHNFTVAKARRVATALALRTNSIQGVKGGILVEGVAKGDLYLLFDPITVIN